MHFKIVGRRVADPSALLSCPVTQLRVPLDKSEVGVKDKVPLSVFFPPLVSPERLRTKTLEISRVAVVIF
jgi:hypothetical protein